jgi:hypothetical protein
MAHAPDNLSPQPIRNNAITHTTGDEDPDGFYDDGLLHNAGPIMAFAYALSLIVLLFTFSGHTEAFFNVIIVGGVFLVFFGIPYIMLRMRRLRDRRWHSDLEHSTAPSVTTWTGMLKRNDAIAQIIVVPLAVVVLFTSFALIWVLQGP